MLRRRFVMGAASAAITAPLAGGLAGCNGGDAGGLPPPVPPSSVVLSLPKDMYMHPGAPTEWFWHIGTLRAGNRVFGFEINAASFAGYGTQSFAFSQIMLSDIEHKRHYQRTTPYVPPLVFNPETWAQSNVNANWHAGLGDANNWLSALTLTNPGTGYTDNALVVISGGGGDGAFGIAVRNPLTNTIADVVLSSPGQGYTSQPTVTIVGGGGTGATAMAINTYIAMRSPASDPTRNMTVQAVLQDTVTSTRVTFDLRMSQQGRPFFVFGTGMNPGGDGTLATSNFYFSLTRMQTTGTIDIDGVVHPVSGMTWMDHEYGAFGTSTNPVKWILQDMQLDNGVCISNYATVDPTTLALGRTVAGHATVQDPNGDTWYVESTITPVGRTWTSPVSGATYFLQIRVEIPTFNASFMVGALMDDQEFPVASAPVYEGVAVATGTFQGQAAAGTAWMEQAM